MEAAIAAAVNRETQLSSTKNKPHIAISWIEAIIGPIYIEWPKVFSQEVPVFMFVHLKV